MIVTPIKTNIIRSGSISLTSLLDKYLTIVDENSIVVVTSKIVSLCEGNTISKDKISKEDLIIKNASYYLLSKYSKHGYHFAITNNMLAGAAGIDESNGNNDYVLWPKDPQKSANLIRTHLINKFGVKNLGVIITDSTSIPLRLGSIGTYISHSGFSAIRSYIGEKDLFGKPFKVSRANIAGGLAASAVVASGEGTEQTPISVITDVKFVEFQARNPTQKELADLYYLKDEDYFAPFLNGVPWSKGSKNEI